MDATRAFDFGEATCLIRIRKAMQLLTTTGVGQGNGKVLQLENWTDTKVPISNGNGQHALPVSA